MIRQPAVAGMFYPDAPDELAREVESFTAPRAAEPARALACVVPHAGYRYSGRVAGAVYARLELPRRYIILCPRHYPQGAALAIHPDGEWLTPLGSVPVDAELAAELKHECPPLREDSVAHREEHALEVQLPFLQRLVGEFRFVAIALGPVRYETMDQLGLAIARVVAKHSEPILVVASSDMNHYESDEVTRTKDRKAIARMLALDARGLYDTVHREEISMCGVGPATVMLTAAKQLGARQAVEVQYATSGDADGRRQRVVGYAGILVQ
jgi:hypothetical protein